MVNVFEASPPFKLYCVIACGLWPLAIFIPFSIKYIFVEFFKWRNAAIMQKRHFPIAFAISILCVFTVISISCNLFGRLLSTSAENQSPLQRIGLGVFALCWIGTGNLLWGRFWLLFYSIKFNKIMKDNLWKSVIDDYGSQKNLYIRYRSTWGNEKFVGMVILIATVVFISIVAVGEIVF